MQSVVHHFVANFLLFQKHGGHLPVRGASAVVSDVGVNVGHARHWHIKSHCFCPIPLQTFCKGVLTGFEQSFIFLAKSVFRLCKF